MKSRKSDERTTVRERFFAGVQAWTGEDSKGWFRSPRTLPMVLALLRSKDLSGRLDPSMAYLALWARHLDSGVIEITNEQTLAYESGYTGSRALRTWHERMRLLEKLGFIKSKKIGNESYRYVALLDPVVAVASLVKAGKVDASWKDAYDLRRIETREGGPVEAAASAPAEKVVAIRGTGPRRK